MSDSDKSKEKITTAAIVPPFHERFNIKIGMRKAKENFKIRLVNGIYTCYPNFTVEPLDWIYNDVMRCIATKLAIPYGSLGGVNLFSGFQANYADLLEFTEALYEAIKIHRPDELWELNLVIEAAISLSEIDLGIRWKNGAFWPSGAKLLDEELVNEPMQWLSTPKYKNVLSPFQKGLKHYMEATKDSSKLSDSITDMYEALEKLARIVNNNDKTLGANAAEFVDNLKLSDRFGAMLLTYCKYAHDYRHAVKQEKDRIPPVAQEAEAFIYMTGLFIRLAVRQIDS